MLDELLEAWRTNNRINLMLLDAVSPEGLASTLSRRGGRDVARQFAHLHTQRIRWLEAKGGADLAEALPRFASRESPGAKSLARAFEASGAAVTTYLCEVAAGERRPEGLKKGIVVGVGYFVAHESHHRGSILLTLKQCGHAVPKATAYGIWDWQRI